MSGHGQHDADADLHAGHDDHHDETSSDDFPADEPHSPGWLPLLGGGILIAIIFTWLALSPSDATAEAAKVEAPVAKPAAAAVQAPAVRPAFRPAPPIRPGSALPPGHEQFAKPQ